MGTAPKVRILIPMIVNPLHVMALSVMVVGLFSLFLYLTVRWLVDKGRWDKNAIVWYQVTVTMVSWILGVFAYWNIAKLLENLGFNLQLGGHNAMGGVFFAFFVVGFCGSAFARLGAKRLKRAKEERGNSSIRFRASAALHKSENK